MRQNERGYFMITVGGTLFILLSLFALVADFGHIYVTKAQLQNTTDSAALAAVAELPDRPEAAVQEAQRFGGSHWVAGQSITILPEHVRAGRYDPVGKAFVAGDEPYNSIQIHAGRAEGSPEGALQLFFAPLFGKSTSNVRATSIAFLDSHVIGVHGKNRLIPYSVIDFVVDQDRDGKFDIGRTINIHPRNDAPGNFGFLDLDNGSNDVPELRLYIEEGYDKDFTIPPGGSVPVLGSTGIDGESLINSFKVILGEVVFLPVHNRVDYNGSGAVYNVIALLAVRIHNVRLNTSQENRYINTEIIHYASSVLVIDPNAPENNSVAKPRLVV